MTEEEAKSKWCPQARVLADYGLMIIATANRGDIQESVNCIASDCAMWVRTNKVTTSDTTWEWEGHCGLINAK